MLKTKKPTIAYFSMEFALDDRIPNYAGGLGVLAGDTVYAAADLKIPFVGVSLIYHQSDDQELAFQPKKLMKKCRQTVSVDIEGRKIKILIWRLDIKSKQGHTAPIFFLSTNSPENKRWDRDLTKNLYAGDAYTRLGQEIILGIGGARALKKLGYNIKQYHLNEGHAALLTLEKLKDFNNNKQAVMDCCSFTTHTVVDSGHDYFNYGLARQMLGDYLPNDINELSLPDRLGMTELALSLCKKTNGVSFIHKRICEQKFIGYKFDYITNGIYHNRWIGKHMKKLLDSYLQNWHQDPAILLKIFDNMPPKEIIAARQEEKKDFVAWLNKHKSHFPLQDVDSDDYFKKDILTIGFARRLVPYKRPDLIFRDIERLRRIGDKKLQLVFAGNCYENDIYSSGLVNLINRYAKNLRHQVKIAFIPRYNLKTGHRLVAGCDLWLNNPVPGREASGTSGMKAALNGVPNLSTMDGWWVEAYKTDNRCGWGFGEYVDGPDRDASDHNQLMNNLENIIDCYYNRKDEWLEKTMHSVTLAAYFNTYRMINEYMDKMWK